MMAVSSLGIGYIEASDRRNNYDKGDSNSGNVSSAAEFVRGRAFTAEVDYVAADKRIWDATTESIVADVSALIERCSTLTKVNIREIKAGPRATNSLAVL
uniref:Uncharacterized protein n=1 Tax=Parascaris equorum TaxID=6256 RepID=A0A914SBI8_PAREQ